ncbi:g8159 [Coccomyxa elongata]
MRKIVEEVDIGKVLLVGDGFAVIQGLNNDAPVGCSLKFVSGASGVLLWRRSDNICLALLLGGVGTVEVGEGVECRIRAILQVVDEQQGPMTKREYDVAKVPVGDELAGKVVDFLGRAPGTQVQLGTSAFAPLFGEQPDMESREQIAEALVTGVKALDMLTPLGRGQALLVTGMRQSGKTSLVLDAILGQYRSGVRCIYAAIGQSVDDVSATMALLKRKDALAYTTVVAAPEGASLGERYAAISSAIAVGERVRDCGGHALVIIDDLACMVEVWESITAALATLGPTAFDEEEGNKEQEQEMDEEKLVEYEGMLVAASAAQRRRFFSSLIQRAAKLHKRLGGGSLTLLPVLAGAPARGEGRPAAVAQYKHVSEEQRAKLQAALETARRDQLRSQQEGCVRTEVLEEFMSIADGQVVLQRESGSGRVTVDPQASVSRIGSRAYPPALADLAVQLRFELAQAVDAARFGHDPDAAALREQASFAEQARAALAQTPGHPVPLEEQVATLYALQSGFFRDVSPSNVPLRQSIFIQSLRRSKPGVLRDIASTQQLTDEARAGLGDALEEISAAFSPSS